MGFLCVILHAEMENTKNQTEKNVMMEIFYLMTDVVQNVLLKQGTAVEKAWLLVRKYAETAWKSAQKNAMMGTSFRATAVSLAWLKPAGHAILKNLRNVSLFVETAWLRETKNVMMGIKMKKTPALQSVKVLNTKSLLILEKSQCLSSWVSLSFQSFVAPPFPTQSLSFGTWSSLFKHPCSWESTSIKDSKTFTSRIDSWLRIWVFLTLEITFFKEKMIYMNLF